MSRIERLFVYGALLFLALRVAAEDEAPPDAEFGRLRVRDLVLVDGGGREVGFLRVAETGAFLDLANREGNRAAYLGATGTDGTGFLQLCAADGAGRVEGLCTGRGGTLATLSEESRIVTLMGAASDTGAGLVLVNRKDGVRGVELATNATGGYVQVKDAEGRRAVHAACAKEKGGYAATLAADGSETARLGPR